MKVDWLSKSAIDAFRQCPKRFEYERIKRAPKCFQPIEWEIGSIVHNLINSLMQGFKNHPTFQGVIGSTKNEEWFATRFQEDIQELTRKVEIGEVRLVKPDVGIEDFTAFGRECLTNFTKHVLPKLANHRILQSEGGFPPNFIVASVKIGGKFDLVVEGQGYIHVHDWKTGRARKNDDFQAKLYYFAAKRKYTSSSVSDFGFFLHYLAAPLEEITQSFDFSEDVFVDLVSEIAEIKGAIEATTNFSARTSKLCHWCPYSPVCEEGLAFVSENPLRSEDALDEFEIN